MSQFSRKDVFRAASTIGSSIWPGHFELHVPVMGYGLKACECVSPQQGVISAVERCHVEEQLFGPVVLRCAEYDVKFNLPRASCFLTGDNALKCGAALLNATFVHLHFLERIFVDEVQSAATVHDHFGEPKAIHKLGLRPRRLVLGLI